MLYQILVVIIYLVEVLCETTPTPFVTVSPITGSFMIEDTPATFVGTNSLFLAQFADAFSRNDLFQRMNENNMTLLRLWAFSDGIFCPSDNWNGQNYFQCWDNSTSSIYINETALALHLDTTLAEAGIAGIRVILSLTNNWPAYGGIPAYISWRIAAATAGVASPYSFPGFHDDFYGEDVLKSYYKTWIQTLTERKNTISGVFYKDDPTILAWELGNEIACQGASETYPCIVNGTSPLMRSWISEMSTFIKSLDPNHLVTIGEFDILHVILQCVLKYRF